MDRYDADALGRWMAAVFEACRVPPAEAALAARVLLRTSLRGIDTHGVSRLPVYAQKLRAGEVNPRPAPRVAWRHGALQIDGDGGLGQVVAMRAVDEALARAKGQAVVACTLRNSGHLAALAPFVLHAAEAGCVALLCQRTPPLMALPGAAGPGVGNNPIAFAAPVPDGAPLVFDMAASVVARGHVLQAARDGRAIPADWALGPDGQPTTDAARALQGAMQPLAGHKGLGLALLVDGLSGWLVGEPSPADGPMQTVAASPSGISAFLLVLNPDLFMGREAFDASARHALGHYLRSGGPEARYPGQRQAACEGERRERGIPVPGSVVRELRAAGEGVGCGFGLEPV